MTPDPLIIPAAEPFFFPGERSNPGCLLIHGFTGTPKEMRGFGEHLAGQGYTAMGVRLAGHATHPGDMIRSTYRDWMTSVEDGYRYLSGMTKNVYLVGLSMGGALSLLMSTKLDVKGVVAISTPAAMPKDYPLWLIRFVAYFRPFLSKSKDPPGTGWFDREVWKDHVSYPRNPTRSVGELKLLLNEMRQELPRVDVPVFLIHSRDDTYVLPQNMDHIHAALGARDKEMLWIKGSGHVVTRDAAHAQAFEAVVKFIRRVEASA